MNTAAAVRGLSVSFGDNVILKGVDLDIPKNSVTALIGPSGCGKSTFLKCVNRLIDEDGPRVSGSVIIAGENILSARTDLAKLRRRVGMVFQAPVVFPGSIFHNVAYGIRLHERAGKKELRRRVEEALCAAALEELLPRLHEPAACLSGGQQQRLSIARALAVGPDILLLDEPTAALDPVSTMQIEKLIASIKHHITPVIVTHNLSQARRIADRVVFFSHRTVMQAGTTAILSGEGARRELSEYIGME